MLKEEKMSMKISLSLGMNASRFKKRTYQYKKKGNYFSRDHYTCTVHVLINAACTTVVGNLWSSFQPRALET